MNNVGDILRALQEIIARAESNMITPDNVVAALDDLENQGFIRTVGKGTNRRAVVINGDISPYVPYKGLNKQCVIKIPYALKKGINDNQREMLLYHWLLDMEDKIHDPDIKYLIDRLPWVSPVQGFPLLTAQELVTPIEDVALNRTHSTNVTADNDATTCKKYLLQNHKAEVTRLLTALDKFFVYADLNPLATPLQYGFKNINGQVVLTILDTGYAMPKFPELEEVFNSGQLERRSYIVIGRDIDVELYGGIGSEDNRLTISSKNSSRFTTANLKELVPRITLYGVYMLDDPNNASNQVRNFVSDIEYFKMIYNTGKSLARTKPGTSLHRYYQFITGSKD